MVNPSHLRRLARDALPDVLSAEPVSLVEIYASMKRRFSEYCDDSVLCDCSPNETGAEWQHRIRSALQDVRKRGIAVYERESRTWRKQ